VTALADNKLNKDVRKFKAEKRNFYHPAKKFLSKSLKIWFSFFILAFPSLEKHP